MARFKKPQGFTLIELVAVLVLAALLAALLLPRLVNLSSSARVATLRNVERNMISTISLVKAQAVLSGLSSTSSNPGTAQSNLILDLGSKGSAELDWRNLCPESLAELGDMLSMLDFINLKPSADLRAFANNRWTLIGYEVPGFDIPTDEGCYLAYDSFGVPNCTVTFVDVDC